MEILVTVSQQVLAESLVPKSQLFQEKLILQLKKSTLVTALRAGVWGVGEFVADPRGLGEPSSG